MEGSLSDYEETSAIWCNRVYVCPRCGEPWAEVHFSCADSFRSVARGCESHAWYKDEPNGSLLEDFRRDLRLLPPKALWREVLLAMQRLDPTFPRWIDLHDSGSGASVGGSGVVT